MAGGRERAPIERETLVFDNAESASTFRERVQQRSQEAVQGVDVEKEAVAQELAAEFDAHGEGVERLRNPWEHTEQEHAETQSLIDVAFSKDLGAALREARASEHYPRNMDLFHDILTHEMYSLVRQEKLNTQPVGLWVAGGVLFIVLILLLVVSLFVL